MHSTVVATHSDVMMQRRAVVIGTGRDLRPLVAWCQRAGIDVVAVTADPASALAMLCADGADVVVIAREAQWRDLLPQVLVAGESPRVPRPRRLR